MWLFAMFDLPVKTREQKRQATAFRKALLSRGFMMLQYSVYARYCSGEEVAKRYTQQISTLLPEDGQVRLLRVTEAQFGKMKVFVRGMVDRVEQQPNQFLLF